MDKQQEKKYKHTVLYFIKHCNNQYLGETKLNKLLYYFDFVNHRERGKSVTGDVYCHLDFGPVPKKAREIISSLVGDNVIEREEVLLDEGGHKVRYRAKSEPSMSVFTKTEKELLEKICRKFKTWNTKKIIAQTHLEAPWFYSSPGENIRYKYATDIDII